MWFLIQLVGDGTKRLGAAKQGDIINVVLPLGNSFTMPEKPSDKLLLVGGGVGTAPMLYLGEQLAKNGSKPTFLLGARSDKDLLQLEEFCCLWRCIYHHGRRQSWRKRICHPTFYIEQGELRTNIYLRS